MKETILFGLEIVGLSILIVSFALLLVLVICKVLDWYENYESHRRE